MKIKTHIGLIGISGVESFNTCMCFLNKQIFEEKNICLSRC